MNGPDRTRASLYFSLIPLLKILKHEKENKKGMKA